MPENRDLSNLGTFENVVRELGLSVGTHDLYRNPEGRIVLFRGQQVDYPDRLLASTNPEIASGVYGDGAYFGNSPAAVNQFVRYGNEGLQAYLLPEIDEGKILQVSRHALRRNPEKYAAFLLHVFVAPLPEIEYRCMYKRGEGPRQKLWIRIPASAQEVIDNTNKLAYLGKVGVGGKRFSR